jgi:hypothetical protein
MVGNKGITAIRITATIAMGGLSGLLAENPHNTWALLAVIIGSALGIHVIPAISQNGITMSTGPELMGLVRPTEPATTTEVPVTPASAAVNADYAAYLKWKSELGALVAVEPAVEAAETAVKTPDAATLDTAVEDAVTAGEAVSKTSPDVIQALRDAADALHKVADNLL